MLIFSTHPCLFVDALVVKPSTLPDAGRGLFANQDFAKGQRITEYCGELIDHKQALALRAEGKAQYVRVVEAQHSYIDGVKDPSKISSAGWASMANDSEKPNAVFDRVWEKSTARYRVFIKAKRAIANGEEIFVSYGKGYWTETEK
jgi:hypothetical protein